MIKQEYAVKKTGVILLLLMLFCVLISCREKKTVSDAYGNFEAVDITVSAEVNGKILYAGFNEGDLINKGTQVCKIDTIPFQLQIEELTAKKNIIDARIITFNRQIDVINEQQAILEKDRKRFSQMLKDSAATQKQVDDIEGQIKIHKKEIENLYAQIKAVGLEKKVINKNIDRIRYDMSKCYIKFPVKGTVLEKYIEESELAVRGKPVFRLADLSEMYLRAYVSETQLSKLGVGKFAEVLIDDGRGSFKKYKGIISFISDEAEFTPKIIQTREERVNLVYLVKIKVHNDGSIKIGMPGEVKFNYE